MMGMARMCACACKYGFLRASVRPFWAIHTGSEEHIYYIRGKTGECWCNRDIDGTDAIV